MTDHLVTDEDSLEAVAEGNEHLVQLALVRAWLDLNPRVDRPMSREGARWRHSWAASCSRKVQYEIEQLEPTEPFTPGSLWVFAVGQVVHDHFQPALQHAFPGVTLETRVNSLGNDGAGSVDAIMRLSDDRVISWEFKSLNGTGYKSTVGARNGGATGIRNSALVQLACNAASEPGCIGGYAVVVALEQISENIAGRYGIDDLSRFMHIKWFTIDELRPIAEAEFARVEAILLTVDRNARDERAEGEPDKILVRRSIPDPALPSTAVITDPAKGTWVDFIAGTDTIGEMGTTWHCSYCNFRSMCIEDGA